MYKGSVTVNQTTASASHAVQQVAQVKFNAVRLDAINLASNAGTISIRGPFFVIVDSLKPICFDLVGGNLSTPIGGAQTDITGNSVSNHLAPIKRTSWHQDRLRTPITVSIVDSTGTLLDLTAIVGPTIAVSFSLWEVTDVYSSSD